jgi:hypothetical protein
MNVWRIALLLSEVYSNKSQSNKVYFKYQCHGIGNKLEQQLSKHMNCESYDSQTI